MSGGLNRVERGTDDVPSFNELPIDPHVVVAVQKLIGDPQTVAKEHEKALNYIAGKEPQ